MSYYSVIKESTEGEPKSKKTLGQMLIEFDAITKKDAEQNRHKVFIKSFHDEINRQCQKAIDEIKVMADSALKAINYSAGQQARRMRERLNHDR